MSIESGRVEGVGRAGCEVIVFRRDVNGIEDTGSGDVGNDDDGVQGRTLRAVAGNAAADKIVFTCATGYKRRRSAAITVECPLASESEHGLAELVVVEALGVVGVTTVVHNEDESAVFLNADHRTCGGFGGAFFSFRNKHTVVNNHCKVSADCLPLITAKTLCMSTKLTGTFACNLVFIDTQHSLTSTRMEIVNTTFSINKNLTVVNKVGIRSIIIIRKSSIHGSNNLITEFVFIVLSDVGHTCCFPVIVIRQILVDVVITWNNGYIGIRRV